MIADILHRHPIFAALPADEIALLQGLLTERKLQAGEILLVEGGASDCLFLVMDGGAEIIKSMGTSEERLLAVRENGALLGEMSLFSQDGRHTASVRARTPLKLMEITRVQFYDLLRRRPEMAVRLVESFSRRLEESENVTVRDLREKNRQLTAAYEALQAAQAQLVEKEKLERELEIASKLQMSILPQALPCHAGFDFGAVLVPARSVGGDFYDFIPLGGNRLGIVVGDVCDKGIPAALFMTLTYTAMREAAQLCPTPGSALRAVNRRLVEMNAAEMYVTLLYGILDTATREFAYARAGHPHPLVLDSECRALLLPGGAGQPVGLFDSLMLDEQVVTLGPGHTLLIFSDGLSEALESDGRACDLGGLCQSLVSAGARTSQELCAGLWKVVEHAVVNTPGQDDFTAIAVRVD